MSTSNCFWYKNDLTGVRLRPRNLKKLSLQTAGKSTISLCASVLFNLGDLGLIRRTEILLHRGLLSRSLFFLDLKLIGSNLWISIKELFPFWCVRFVSPLTFKQFEHSNK